VRVGAYTIKKLASGHPAHDGGKKTKLFRFFAVSRHFLFREKKPEKDGAQEAINFARICRSVRVGGQDLTRSDKKVEEL
jgi:hypothetical protein